MKALPPISITSAALVGASAPENDYPEWSGSTGYAAGSRVIRTQTHRVYERQVAGTGATPPESDDTVWLDVGPTNRWAMFDESPSTSTTASGSVSVMLAPGAAVGDIVLSGVIGSSVAVLVNGSTVRTASVPAILAPSTSSDLVITGLGIAAGAQVGIVVSGSGPVSVGALLLGTLVDLGETLPGAQVGITDYSTADTNTYGITSIVRRRYSRRVQCSVRIATTDTDRVSAVLDDLRARVCWWAMDDAHSALQVAGWYKDWSIEIKGATETVYSITIEGLARDDVSIAPEAGNLSAPPVITGITAAMAPGGVRVSWDQSPDVEWSGSEWRVGATWAGGVRIFRGAATDFVWLAPSQGAQTIWGVNFDTFGEESAPVPLSMTIDGSVLTVSIGGGNQLFNSDFGLGWRGWSSVNGGIAGTRGMDVAGWTISALSPVAGHTASISQGAPIGNAGAYTEEWGDPIPVTPLDWYCASAYTGAHRCVVAVFAYYFDAAGGVVGQTYGPAATCENAAEASGGPTLSGYKRIHGTGQAPATARTARLVLRKYDTKPGQASSYLFACRALFEQVDSAASTPSPWSPGPNGYTGDLDATRGAPVDTLVGSTLAQNVESISGAQAKADAAHAAAVSTAASYAAAKALLAEVSARAYADGVVDAEESRAIADATTKANAARAAAEAAAAADATAKAAVAATTATWSGVSGAGRPQDNATVGAAFGSNISGQIVPETLTQYVAANTIHESASLALSGGLSVNMASPTVTANAAGGVLVIVNGAVTVGDEPNSANPPTVGRLVLVVNGVAVGYSVPGTGIVATGGASRMFTAVASWSGSISGTVTAYIVPQRTAGSQAVGITSGSTISIISLKG